MKMVTFQKTGGRLLWNLGFAMISGMSSSFNVKNNFVHIFVILQFSPARFYFFKSKLFTKCFYGDY